MYRTAAKRLLVDAVLSKTNNTYLLGFPNLTTLVSSSRFSIAANPQQLSNPSIHYQTANYSEPSSSSSPQANGSASSAAGNGPRRETRRTGDEYVEEQARVLRAALLHVPRLGWTKEAMIEGAREVGVSPSIVGSFPRKEAALIEFFMNDCLQRLTDIIDLGDELRNLIPSQLISKLVRIRLEMHAPYISKWPQALSIQSHPSNIPTSFKQRAILVDEIWHAAGDEATDIDWYVKRTILGGIYSTVEIYMLTDSSPDFHDTWVFLDDRLKDAFDLKKTIQEARYLAEAVSAGTGRSLQRFVSKVFPQ